ncbi:MAG: hypothetical protein COA84_10950 [Robiginitomaculum sp.]|nr:MAG: hypothetical protein COA84_10950 [Robiginitomaculum sp.]
MTEEASRPLPETDGGALKSAPKTVRPLEDIKAQADTRLAEQARRDQAEKAAETADRGKQIESFILENNLLNNEAIFGDKPLNDKTMAIAVKLLLDVENKARQGQPNFDITKIWNGETAKKYLERKYSKKEVQSDRVEDDTDDEKYTKAISKVRAENPNIDNLTLAKELKDNHANDIPPEYLSKIQAFVQMQALAKLDDKDIVTAKINSLDFSAGIPSPILFVETQILSDDNLSESYRDTVAKQFNLPNPRVKTGGQVNQALDARDPDGNPLYTAANPVDIGRNTQAYVKPDGSRAVRVDMGDGRPREIPWDRNTESDDVIGTKISLAKIWAVNEWDGQTDFFGESIDIENDILSQTDPQKLTKVRNTMNAIFGGTRGFDAVIIQDNEAAFVGWFNQFLFPKGDAAIGDFDKETAVTNRENIGINPKGHPEEIDYEVLRAAALFTKDQYGTGTPNYFALQRHLHEMFPEKDIPLTGENAPEGKKTDSDS